MEFGRITEEELDKVGLNLPADHPENSKILSGRDAPSFNVYVGCAKWGRKDWIGKIYPEKTKEADFLKLYSQHFNSVELNATFYKIPSKSQTASWANQVSADFKFCPKFSQSITHIRRLKNASEATDRFLTGVSGFGDKLGPLFLMPHPQMGPKALESIQLFLEALPADLDVFFELRHADWFSDPITFNTIAGLLIKKRIGMIITDAAGRRDCVHMRLTTPEAFIRFVGNGLHPSDYTRVDDWVERIKAWKNQGLQKVYFFMHQHEELHSPELCRYFILRLNEKCGTNIPVPEFVGSI
jgi:uncharacterized protein YecE (DUF72 family)